ncbi:ribulokinase [Paenibacillus sp. FJAT-26967]|uniref:ribulokinase n=1 Tax=Paenibacillus sp. FJAT-26967 TaxID=1729690 RepID=UPI000838BFAA|nr:ribulokinase [Paenibacillus sp. FJAT-26967]
MNKRYVIGIDFGTESGRAVLVDAGNGEEISDHVTVYPHGVINEALPDSGKLLGPDWALQQPDDYLEVLRRSVPEVLRSSCIDPAQVIGIGIDFTSSTVMPVDKAGTPLCLLEAYKDEPHAYVKLWKHHAAQRQADRLNETAAVRGEAFLERYGGRTSSEWMVPKAWQVLSEAPQLYEAADQFLEAADWVVLQLTGRVVRSSCCAGYKALWHKTDGYPEPSFFAELDPGLEHFAETKLRGTPVPLGTKAGGLTAEAAAMTGLCPGTAVAVGIIDAHAAVPAVGAVHAGQMVMAMGTSLCHILLGDREIHVEGISGVVEDGIIPGLFGYEAGQPAAGDIFGWYVEQGVPGYVEREAAAQNISIHAWLESRAARLAPGGHGLLVLDWWNGNRSVLDNAGLSGMILGLTLGTRPEEIYRALLEATAFGTRKVIETFEAAGVQVEQLYACGGLPQRNRLLMQIYADVTGREIRLPASKQTTALGAAMFGAVAAGEEHGGYRSIADAAAKMARLREETYRPNPANTAYYEELYQEYNRLHDYFGRGGSDVMKRLKEMRLGRC